MHNEKTLRSEIHTLINSICNKEELPDQWKQSITAPVDKKGDKTDCIINRGTSLLPTSHKMYPIFFSQG
jgi:hypothetical protein